MDNHPILTSPPRLPGTCLSVCLSVLDRNKNLEFRAFITLVNFRNAVQSTDTTYVVDAATDPHPPSSRSRLIHVPASHACQACMQHSAWALVVCTSTLRSILRWNMLERYWEKSTSGKRRIALQCSFPFLTDKTRNNTNCFYPICSVKTLKFQKQTEDNKTRCPTIQLSKTP